MNFIDWFVSNWYSNFFTLITVVLSGIISLVISALYYHKGNRNNLKMAVIHPIVRLLADGYSRKNYDTLCAISKEYSTRYMSKNETKKLVSLLSYFEYKLKEHNIDVKPVPMEYEGEIVYYDYPPDLHYLSYDLERILKKNDTEIEPDESKSAIIALYAHYCKKYYTSEHIEYFDDYSLREVLSKSKIREAWDKKFDTAKEAKEQFLNLKIAKELLGK